MPPTIFTNARLCQEGKLSEPTSLAISEDGYILDITAQPSNATNVNLKGAILAPGFIELQTNGMRGFHFTHFDGDAGKYRQNIEEVAKYLPSTGVTAFYATIPTVGREEFQKVRRPSSAL